MTTITSGTILADTYEITEQIGSGGGGIVFKGRHLRLGTDIIVKKIKDEVVTWVDTQNEANLLKNLKHQYLPKVYDFIEGEDGVYTVMDFINGDDMDTTVRRHGKYPQKQVLKWAQQLGSALEYLHNQKVPIIQYLPTILNVYHILKYSSSCNICALPCESYMAFPTSHSYFPVSYEYETI